MSTRIEQILAGARITLADKKKQRWTDEDLLSKLSDACKDLARHSKVLKGREEISLNIGQAYFEFPTDCWMITRVMYAGIAIPLVSHTELDQEHGNYNAATIAWEETTGYPEAIVYDRINMQQGKVYPIPDESITDTTYAFVRPEDREAIFAGDELFGVTSAIGDDYTFNSDYGVVTELYDPLVGKETFSSPYGIITSINEVNAVLTVYYIKDHPTLTTVDDEILLPSVLDQALRYYVVGNAFLDDLNEEYQAKGRQQLGFYDRELKLATSSSKQDNTRASQYKTDYRSAF